LACCRPPPAPRPTCPPIFFRPPPVRLPRSPLHNLHHHHHRRRGCRCVQAVDLKHQVLVALKRIRLEVDNEGIPPTAIREVAILKELNHPNVVRCVHAPCPRCVCGRCFLRVRRGARAGPPAPACCVCRRVPLLPPPPPSLIPPSLIVPPARVGRLLDVFFKDANLFLVFEFVKTDLKHVMDTCRKVAGRPLPAGTVKVRPPPPAPPPLPPLPPPPPPLSVAPVAPCSPPPPPQSQFCGVVCVLPCPKLFVPWG
jgi:hypothetical protein